MSRQPQRHVSKFESETLRGNAKQIRTAYEQRAEDARKSGDAAMAERYFQQAEYWIKKEEEYYNAT